MSGWWIEPPFVFHELLHAHVDGLDERLLKRAPPSACISATTRSDFCEQVNKAATHWTKGWVELHPNRTVGSLRLRPQQPQHAKIRWCASSNLTPSSHQPIFSPMRTPSTPFHQPKRTHQQGKSEPSEWWQEPPVVLRELLRAHVDGDVGGSHVANAHLPQPVSRKPHGQIPVSK